MQKRIKNKRAIVADYLPWILIAVAVLAIVMVSILLLKKEGTSFIDSIKYLFRGR